MENANRAYSKYKLTDKGMQQKIRALLLDMPGAVEEQEANCLYRARVRRGAEEVFVRQFLSGTLTVDGPPASFAEVDNHIKKLLATTGVPEGQFSSGKLTKQEQAVKSLDLGNRWIGMDEAGKGDYFGSLVSAAVLVDEKIAAILETLGVQDSKRISDERIGQLATQINQVCGQGARVVSLKPEAYNRLYTEFKAEGKKLNELLAWTHARALEDLLVVNSHNQIAVLVDQFGKESYMQRALLQKSKTLDVKLVQLPKAEVNMAVAAASILARAEFLKSLKQLAKECGVELPKGGSNPQIIAAGRKVLEKSGETSLGKVAKLHFKTTGEVLQKGLW